MPPKKVGRPRSASRGRPATKASPARSGKKETPAAKKGKGHELRGTHTHDMAFDEGAEIMARWPGTSLYFKAKVNFVRDDDNEYDVQYEDGTIFTIKAKDVKKRSIADDKPAKKATPSRSRSRGRSPARKKSPARTASTSAAAKPKSPASTSRVSRRSTVTAPKPDPTPTRASARIAAKVELSSDEDDAAARRKSYLAPVSSGKKGIIGTICSTFHWVPTAICTVVVPLIVLSLHQLCQKGSCKLAVPQLSRKWESYWHLQSFGAMFLFFNLVRLMAFLPVGNLVKAASGATVRMNGFATLLAFLACVPALVFRKVDVSFATKNYYHLMTSTLLCSVLSAAGAYVKSRWAKKSALNPKGSTGNFIVDFYYGREFNPSMGGFDVKLVAFRASMIALALINVLLVLDSVNSNRGVINGAVMATAAFQIIFAIDAMYFEEYFFFSHEAMNSGYGFRLAFGYLTFPFIPTLVTRYVIAKSPALTAFQLTSVVALNVLGYFIFRSSETNRCEMAKNPSNPALRHLDSISAVGGKRILCSGWNGMVRYPNHLGEILINWSWVMPAVSVAARVDLLIYYLPIMCTLLNISLCNEQNKKNKRKYGTAWDTYCERVRSNLIPKIY